MTAPIVSQKALFVVARAQYERHRDGISPDDRTLALVEAALAHCDDSRDYRSYGPLRTPIAERHANDVFIEWAAESVAHFVPVRHFAHAALEPKCIFVSSQQIDRALKFFDEAGRPSSGFEIPIGNAWSFVDSLARLQTEILSTRCGSSSLLDAPHWQRIAFILNFEYHWSVLMLIREVDGNVSLFHYDSLGEAHVPFMWRVCKLLYATGLIPREYQPVKAKTTAQQKGAWECGYAVVARLFEHGFCTFETKTETWPAMICQRSDYIIANTQGELKSFLLFLRDRALFAAEANKWHERWKRTYQR